MKDRIDRDKNPKKFKDIFTELEKEYNQESTHI